MVRSSSCDPISWYSGRLPLWRVPSSRIRRTPSPRDFMFDASEEIRQKLASGEDCAEFKEVRISESRVTNPREEQLAHQFGCGAFAPCKFIHLFDDQ